MNSHNYLSQVSLSICLIHQSVSCKIIKMAKKPNYRGLKMNNINTWTSIHLQLYIQHMEMFKKFMNRTVLSKLIICINVMKNNGFSRWRFLHFNIAFIWFITFSKQFIISSWCHVGTFIVTSCFQVWRFPYANTNAYHQNNSANIKKCLRQIGLKLRKYVNATMNVIKVLNYTVNYRLVKHMWKRANK